MQLQFFYFFLILIFQFQSICSFSQDGGLIIENVESTILFRNYPNRIKIGFNSEITNHEVKCSDCDTIFPIEKNSFEYIIIPGSTKTVTIEVYSNINRDEVFGTRTYNVFNLPTPTLCLDSLESGGSLDYIPKELFAKYSGAIYMNVTFTIDHWEVNIGDKYFIGKESVLTNEVLSAIKENRQDVDQLFITAIYYGPDKTRRLAKGEFWLKN